MTTYIHDGVEVVLTGRLARREGKHVRSRTRSQPLIDVLVEIEPVDKNIEWKKWVKKEELYEVTDTK